MKLNVTGLSHISVLLAISLMVGCGHSTIVPSSISDTSPSGAVESQLTFDAAIEYAPSFRPDGEIITYARMSRENDHSITKFWTMDLKGRHKQRLTKTEMVLDEWTPMWSPDGTSLVWCSGRTGNLDNWKIDRNGEVHTQLTSALEADNFPIWRPDGKKIAFMSEREGRSGIWVMDPDGSNPARVSTRQTGDLGVSWSRNGKHLAYVAAVHPDGVFHAGAWVILHKEPPANGVIVVQNAETGEVTQLTSGEHRDWYPMWSPREDKIAFISDRSGNWDIWVMNSDGSHPVQVTSNTGLDKEPNWSPDGRSIVYVSQRNGQWDVWLLNVEQTIIRQNLTASVSHS